MPNFGLVVGDGRDLRLRKLLSIFLIGGAWIAHHGLTDSLDGVDRMFLRLNLLFLLAVSFLPFPTRLVADALEKTTGWQRMAAVVYGCTLLAIRLPSQDPGIQVWR